MIGTSLTVQWLKLYAPNAGGPGSIPGQETRSDMLERRLKIPCTITKTWCSQINKNTGVACHFLLQGIFPTHGLNLHLLSRSRILYPLSLGKPNT